MVADREAPIWNGEFGPVYQNAFDGKADWQEINDSRIAALSHQLELYSESNASWSIWLWKGTVVSSCRSLSLAEALCRCWFSGDGLCRRGHPVHEARKGIHPEEEGGSLTGRSPAANRCSSVSPQTPGAKTKLMFVTYSSQSRNGWYRRYLVSKTGTLRYKSSHRAPWRGWCEKYCYQYGDQASCSARVKAEVDQEELLHEYGALFEGKSMEELDNLAKSFSLSQSSRTASVS